MLANAGIWNDEAKEIGHSRLQYASRIKHVDHAFCHVCLWRQLNQEAQTYYLQFKVVN